MDITLSIRITEKQIPEMIGLLAKMWDNPDPTQQVSVGSNPSVTLSHDAEGTTYVDIGNSNATPVEKAEQSPAPTPAPKTQQATTPNEASPPSRVKLTVSQLQAAAGAFMDANPGNLAVLQGIMADMGVPGLPQLQPVQYDAFAARLRTFGVDI